MKKENKLISDFRSQAKDANVLTKTIMTTAYEHYLWLQTLSLGFRVLGFMVAVNTLALVVLYFKIFRYL